MQLVIFAGPVTYNDTLKVSDFKPGARLVS